MPVFPVKYEFDHIQQLKSINLFSMISLVFLFACQIFFLIMNAFYVLTLQCLNDAKMLESGPFSHFSPLITLMTTRCRRVTSVSGLCCSNYDLTTMSDYIIHSAISFKTITFVHHNCSLLICFSVFCFHS